MAEYTQTIEVAPRTLPQGKKSTVVSIKATAGRVAPWHKVALDGKELETKFVNSSELKATIPGQAIKQAGTYSVNVVSPRESGGSSSSAPLIVTFTK